MMSKRSLFTTITPLPSYITRETVVEALHQHSEMIELNPLVIRHERCKPAPNAPADEFHCIWYELTDKIHYLPGGIISGNVSYKACFHDLALGLQTHVYAPTGLDIKEKWSVGGNMPGEPREVVEIGLTDAPREGLYLREDVDMRCNILTTSFVKKTLKRAHAALVDRLVFRADLMKQNLESDGQSCFTSASIRSAPSDIASRLSYSPSCASFRIGSPDMTPQLSRTMSSNPMLYPGQKPFVVNTERGRILRYPPLVRSPGFRKDALCELDGSPVETPEVKVEEAEPDFVSRGTAVPVSKLTSRPSAIGRAELVG